MDEYLGYMGRGGYYGIRWMGGYCGTWALSLYFFIMNQDTKRDQAAQYVKGPQTGPPCPNDQCI